MSGFLFDVSKSWWLLTLIGVAGIGLIMSGNSRQDRQLLRVGLGLILLGVLLAVLSYVIDTPREKVVKGTHALVNSAVARDPVAMGNYLHPSAALAGWNRKQILEGAPVLADRFGLQSATITGMEIKQEPTMIVLTMRVVARFKSKDLPYDTVPTDWQLDWWQSSDGKWLLKNITPMGGGNLSGNQMSRQYFSGPP